MKQGNCLYHDLGIPDHMGIGCTCPSTAFKKGVSVVEIVVVIICLLTAVWGVNRLINEPASQYDCLRHDCDGPKVGIPVGPM